MTHHAIIQRARRDRQRSRDRGASPLRALCCLALGACVAVPSSASRPVLTNGAYTPIRTGPTSAHPRLTELPAGVPLWAEDKVGGWYKLRLGDLVAYAHEVSVDVLAPGRRPPGGEVGRVMVTPCAAGVRVLIDTGRRVPYRVRQFVDPQRLYVDLFDVRLGPTRWACLPVDDFVGSMRLRQCGPDRVRLAIELSVAQQRGYEVSYPDETGLAIEIRRPHDDPGLRGKVIVLDPGHGGADEGAIGPSGLTEKEANLAVARQVEELLVRRGGRVVLTRDDDGTVAPAGCTPRTELTARVLCAKACHPDIVVSIHCNHPGDGRRGVAGTEAYYWSPMSARPAYLIRDALCEEAGTLSRRVAARPFRVLRETDAPRVLVECCYISCPQEEALLRDTEARRRIATGIVNGLCDYFRAAAPRRDRRRTPGESGSC